MLFTRIFTAAALVAFAAAQSVTKLQFTSTPSEVQAGKAVTIKWTGGDGSPVTITLKKGDPKDLKTVTIITGSATGTSFTWTPPSDVVNGDDYALAIAQGVGENNYTGEFSISGGTGSSSSASSAASTATTTMTSSGVTSVTSTVYQSAVSTGVITMARNTTMVSPTLTGISAGTQSPTSTGSSSSSSSTGNAASNVQAQVYLGAGAFIAALFAL